MRAFFVSSDTFQSTRPRGARRDGDKAKWREGVVSIHAPAGGATWILHLVAESDLFQSTRPRGARLNLDSTYTGMSEFQSTRPRGARRILAGKSCAIFRFQSTRPRGARPPNVQDFVTSNLSFNPRARGGRDSFHKSGQMNKLVSIHAPAGGATILPRYNERYSGVSIHAPAGGATDKGRASQF